MRAIGRAGAGTNNIPVEAMSRRGIPVFNAPGANANAVKELVLAGLLLAARNIAPAWQFVRSLHGDDAALEAAVEEGKKRFVGFELPGRTLGVVGLGAIGVEVANSALALGMKVLGYDPQITVQRAWQLSSSVEQALSLEDLFARADAISVHVPLNEATRELVNAARLALMKPDGTVLNFARAAIVDEAAVIAALDARPSARLRVRLPERGPQGPPAGRHAAAPRRLHRRGGGELRGHGRRAAARVSRERQSPQQRQLPGGRAAARAQYHALRDRQPQRAEHGGPDLHLPRERRLNIADLLNKSRGEYAYTLIDTDGLVAPEVLGRIGAIEGVLSARIV